jgi:hypothetical protein
MQNQTLFFAMLIISTIVLLDFGWFREQFCIIACPYGRFQSVMMDENSITVIYDEKRGEPRRQAGMKKEEQVSDFPEESKCFEKQKASHGKFWARHPMGESPFDTAVRIRMFFGTLKSDEENGITDHIIVCHGAVLKLFTMMWMHHKYEWFHFEKSPGNCAIRLIDNNTQSGGYIDRGYIFGGYDNGFPWKYDRSDSKF